MKHQQGLAWAFVAAFAALHGAAFAQQKTKVDLGKQEYESRCAVCHAVTGKGKGPYTPYLKVPAPDLTVLARNNGGVFPLQRVYDAVEGSGPGHGSREMPIWGRTFAVEAAEYYGDVAYNSDAFVRARILALAEYVNRLQVK
ncbi:cytochrome c [Piscinibacter gummiphilus]|uniref:Cytochrome c n=1 Tax=Piscinibacter gummiphilus TaxID=946333 RepID=A0ABZ0D6H3_9BURK|nr:cytochrome c [Piscinibacter gummiphilus]WOB10633.1 cytochrome c [Piscinibacter gummiphilus]